MRAGSTIERLLETLGDFKPFLCVLLERLAVERKKLLLRVHHDEVAPVHIDTWRNARLALNLTESEEGNKPHRRHICMRIVMIILPTRDIRYRPSPWRRLAEICPIFSRPRAYRLFRNGFDRSPDCKSGQLVVHLFCPSSADRQLFRSRTALACCISEMNTAPFQWTADSRLLGRQRRTPARPLMYDSIRWGSKCDLLTPPGAVAGPRLCRRRRQWQRRLAHGRCWARR